MNQIHTPSLGDEVFEINDISETKRLRSVDQHFSGAEQQQGNEQCSNLSYATSSTLVTSNSEATTTMGAATTAAELKEPEKPISPYGIFFRETVSAIKQQNPTCTFQEISMIVSTMWEALDETQKQVYNQKHDSMKQEYIKSLRAYKQKLEQQEIEQQKQQEEQQKLQQQQEATNKPEKVKEEPECEDNNISAMCNNSKTTPDNVTASAVTTNDAKVSTTSTATTELAPQQIQLLTEAAAAPKCTRENCTKPAIINPDWEDEYCSNECVVIHCRNVFNSWVAELNEPAT